jgi:carbon-monoxide dehydrogenase large subunit
VTDIELDADEETGQLMLLKSDNGDDAGQPINPLMLDGQVPGGSTHMMGHALMEGSLYDGKGRALNTSWKDYKQPTSMDAPLEAVVEHITNSMLAVPKKQNKG